MAIADRAVRTPSMPVRLAILAIPVAVVLACARLLSQGYQSHGLTMLILASVGLTLASLAFGLLLQRFFSREPIRPALRRYNRRLSITMLVYAVVLVLSIVLASRGWAGGPAGYALAIAPAIPVVGVFAVIGLYLREETDEFARSLLSQACLIGAALAFAEATFWGFLETFGKVPHLPMYAASIAFFPQFGMALGILSRRYR